VDTPLVLPVNHIEERDLETRECDPPIALAASIQSVPRHAPTTIGKELTEETSIELCDAKNQEKIADSYSGSSLEGIMPDELEPLVPQSGFMYVHDEEALFFFNNSESDDLDPFNLF
jgi:hypothetical protein